MTRLTLPLMCECLLFFVPLNIYVIGNHLANGMQWALFRYQTSAMGNSLILVHRDIQFVIQGVLRGSSASSTIVWVSGAFLLVAATIVLAIAAARRVPCCVKSAGILTVISGVLFLAAMLVQYGPTLANNHGSSVPVGVPLVIIVGIWLLVGKFDAGERDTENDAG